MTTVEQQIQDMVDAETHAWNARDAEALVSLFHPDMVWPWPPDADSHDPAKWVMVLGRYDRARWKAVWEDLFQTHELVHNARKTVRVTVSAEGDAGFAAVDVDTLWRNRATGAPFHWKGRAGKGYAKVGDRWLMTFHTGLLDYASGHSKIESLERNRSMPSSTVIPVLGYANVREAVDWLCRVFGFAERLRIADHRAQLSFGTGHVVVTGLPENTAASAAHNHSIMVRVANVDKHYEHAQLNGAKVIDAPTSHPYGERQYSVVDCGGHVWKFSQTIADADPASWGGQLLA